MSEDEVPISAGRSGSTAAEAINWGRLHLKWGEALTYAGKSDQAINQFVAAERLDLSTADKAELENLVPKI